METLLQLDWNTVTSVLCSGGTVSLLAKFIMNRAACQLDGVAKKLESITEKLIIVETKLDLMQDLRDMVTEHDRKIVDLGVKRVRPVETC
jgi:hypothetical protein